MKIICKWIFLGKVEGIERPQMKGKIKRVENERPEEIMNMIETLLAQPETVRIIFEKEQEL